MIKQDEVHWVRLGKKEAEGQEIRKTRPVVVITNDEQNAKCKVIIVAPLSTLFEKSMLDES